jgi:CheY-like chemotaxis protein
MPLKILAVEDHAPLRRLIRAELERRTDFQIFEAADGVEAVQKLETLQPDLVLLDINLPKLHGFEVAKHIRTLAPAAYVVFLTQESSPDIVRKALSLGAHGYVQKMSAAMDLLPALDAVLAGRRFVSPSVAFLEWPQLRARRHEILFSVDEARLVDGFTRYVAAALKAGDAAIVLMTAAHEVFLFRELRAQGLDIDDAIARGACRSFDADAAPDPAEFLAAIDGVRAAAAAAGKAHPRVAFCGERAGRLWAAGRTTEAVRLEQFCAGLPDDVDILCGYPVPYTTADQTLTHICAEHTAVSAC